MNGHVHVCGHLELAFFVDHACHVETLFTSKDGLLLQQYNDCTFAYSIFLQYILTFLRKVCDEEIDEKVSNFANFCLRQLRQPRCSSRRLPPSMAEIEVCDVALIK